MSKKYYIIDFDSTFIKLEGLDELAKIALAKNPKRRQLAKEIELITRLGMEGKLSFPESLTKRLELFSANKQDLQKLIKHLNKHISDSVKSNKQFFKICAEQIYILSGGFREWIVPVVKKYGLEEENVIANSFIFDKAGNIIGHDKTNLLAQTNGKVKQLNKLKLKGEIYVIGDGFTDYQIKEAGLAKKFMVFTENIKRDNVIERADHILPNLDEMLYLHKLPSSVSYPPNRIKVLLIGNNTKDTINRLANEKYTMEILPGSTPAADVKAAIIDATVVGINKKVELNAELLKKAKKLLVVFCRDRNQVDLKAAAKLGICVFDSSADKSSKKVIRKVINYINNGDSVTSISLPNLRLHVLKKAHRLMHIHHNRRGIVAKINQILAENNINVDAQYLTTTKEISYVITDVNKEYDQQVIKQLREIAGTIRFRVLY